MPERQAGGGRPLRSIRPLRIRAGTPRKRATDQRGECGGGQSTRGAGSTYRLQLTREFGFAEAADAADYLVDLGVTHAYLSPVLDAVPGSMHGYDVTDHARIRAELGGEEGFRALAKRMHSRGLGVILDIVPEPHGGACRPVAEPAALVGAAGRPRLSPTPPWFDIDWAARDGRMLLPILGGPLGVLPWRPVDRVKRRAGRRASATVFDHLLPLWPGTARLPMRGLVESQHYRLAGWRDAATELNWRRFFDIATLIGIRVEDPAVFNATHEVIVSLVTEGLVDGLRVDHPDGLADPRAYLERLSQVTGGAWVVVEKILAADETLPSDWACAGTTGHDALRVVDGLFLDPPAATRSTPSMRDSALRSRVTTRPASTVRRRRRAGQAGDRHRVTGR